MPKPTTKAQLLAKIAAERQALLKLISPLSPAQMTQPGILGVWSVKDVLAHLMEWEQMFLGWYATGLKGQTPAMPAEGFNWRQLPQLNQRIFEKYALAELADLRNQCEKSYQQILKLVEDLPETDLFTPGRYPWTGAHALVSFILPNTSSHYHWARDGIRKGLKAKR
jgi:uncharacterized protein (TIGR03083 family)